MTASLLLASQHAWEHTFRRDDAGRPLPPRFHRLLMADVERAPTASDAEQLEHALASLEHRHGPGPDGILLCAGWGPGWCRRYSSVPAPVTVPPPMSRWESPILEDIDFCLHIASDNEDRLAAVTQELFDAGRLDQRERLTLREVRSGFVGAGLPAERLPGIGIPADAPLLLGFRSILRDNQAPEERVTIQEGPFAGGTTMHVSRIVLDVEAWYAMDRDRQAALMFAPTLTAAQADALVDDALSDADRMPEVARHHGMVGHAQAAARSRVDNVPKLNRRDFATVDDAEPGTHWVSLQRDRRDFTAARAIMNAADAADHGSRIGPRHANGINAFMEVRRRANFVVPPRAHRAYPFLRDTTPAR